MNFAMDAENLKTFKLPYPYLSENQVFISPTTGVNKKKKIYIKTGLFIISSGIVLFFIPSEKISLILRQSMLASASMPQPIEISKNRPGGLTMDTVCAVFGFVVIRKVGGLLLLPPTTSIGIGYWVGWCWSYIHGTW